MRRSFDSFYSLRMTYLVVPAFIPHKEDTDYDEPAGWSVDQHHRVGSPTGQCPGIMARLLPEW